MREIDAKMPFNMHPHMLRHAAGEQCHEAHAAGLAGPSLDQKLIGNP